MTKHVSRWGSDDKYRYHFLYADRINMRLEAGGLEFGRDFSILHPPWTNPTTGGINSDNLTIFTFLTSESLTMAKLIL